MWKRGVSVGEIRAMETIMVDVCVCCLRRTCVVGAFVEEVSDLGRCYVCVGCCVSQVFVYMEGGGGTARACAGEIMT